MTPERNDAEVWRWAQTFMNSASAEPLPLFGSPEWVGAGGMTRVASAVRAALCWYGDGDPHRRARLLDLELDACWRAAEDDHRLWREQARRIRSDAEQPTHAELQRRRAS